MGGPSGPLFLWGERMAVGGALVGALRVTLGLDSAQFEAGTKRARNIAKRDATEIQRIMGGVKASFAGLATAATAGTLIAAGKRALDYAANLGEVAAAAGITTKELQEYQYAASQVGIEQEEMVKLLSKLTKTMGEAAAGGRSQVATFRELGIALQDANGRFYTAGEVIPKIAEAMKRIESPAERARILTDLFGKSGQKLETLLAGGAQGVNELRDAAHRLGIVLSDEQIQKADQTADRLEELKKVLEARIAGVVSDNAQAIYDLANAMAQAASAAGQFFTNMKGVERLQRDQGWAAGFFASWGEQATAADPKKYTAMRIKQLQQATATRKRLEQQASDRGFTGSFARTKLPKARADEMEALRLLNAARQDPAYQAWLKSERAGRPAAPVPQGGLPVASGGGGGSGRGGGGRERDRTAEYLERFNREMESLKDEQLQLEIDQTQSLDQRAQLEAQRIMNEREAYKIDIDNRVKAGELNAAQAEKLKVAIEQIAADKQTLMWNEINAQKLEEQQRLADVSFDIREDALRLELDSARTQEERRAIETRLLDIEYEREKAALDHLKALYTLGKVTMAEVDAAEDRFNAMGQARGGREAAIRRNTMGPLEQYLDSLPKSAAELNEAYQQVAADGLQSLNDGIVDAIMNAKNLGDVFKNVANQIIADLLRIAVQRSITEPLANALFGGGQGGSGGGGLFASIGKLFGAGGSMGPATDQPPGLAKGGSFMVGGNPGIDRNMLSLNGIPQVRVSAGERVRVTKPGQGGDAAPVQIVPSPYFDVVVDGRVVQTGGGLMRNQTQTASRRGRQRLA